MNKPKKLLFFLIFLFIYQSLSPCLIYAENIGEGDIKYKNCLALFLGANKSFVGIESIVDIDANIKSISPFVKGGRTYIPLRFASERFGSEVIWNGDEQSILINETENKIKMFVGKNIIIVNGNERNIDAAPEIFGGRTFIPIRIFAEAIGKNIFWDDRGLIIISEKDVTLNSEIDKNYISDKINKFENMAIKVKGAYLSGGSVGYLGNINKYVDLANTTELNTYVLDIKDEEGYICYDSEVALAKEIKACKNKYNAEEVVNNFHKNNIHLIGRIVCFQDSILSKAKPEYALKNKNGQVWVTAGNSWLDPSNHSSWSYLTDIAKEAVSKGFDEIQFDYVRFPNGNPIINVSKQNRAEEIESFLSYVKSAIPYIKVSVMVYGTVCYQTDDYYGMGQDYDSLITKLDSLSPMVYPSFYSPNLSIDEKIYQKPDLEPYNVVYSIMSKAVDRKKNIPGKKATLRPYLQAFTATWLPKGSYQEYDTPEIRAQIKALNDVGIQEWILWTPTNDYKAEYFQN